MSNISWLATIVSLIGNFFVNYQRKEGFILWIISNVLWVWIGLNAVEINWAQVTLFLIYTGTSAHGLINWIKADKKRKKKQNII